MTNNIDVYIQRYACENGTIAKIIIPEQATQDDLKGIREMFDVVIQRHFKIESEVQDADTNRII